MLKKLSIIVVLAIFIGISGFANANFWTGNTLLTKLIRCDNFSGVSATECSEGMGYLKGVHDALDIETGKISCNFKIKYSQIERVTLAWLKANQNRLEEPAEVLVKAAIDQEWPCP
jgi:hypothetical protein